MNGIELDKLIDFKYFNKINVCTVQYVFEYVVRMQYCKSPCVYVLMYLQRLSYNHSKNEEMKNKNDISCSFSCY